MASHTCSNEGGPNCVHESTTIYPAVIDAMERGEYTVDLQHNWGRLIRRDVARACVELYMKQKWDTANCPPAVRQRIKQCDVRRALRWYGVNTDPSHGSIVPTLTDLFRGRKKQPLSDKSVHALLDRIRRYLTALKRAYPDAFRLYFPYVCDMDL